MSREKQKTSIFLAEYMIVYKKKNPDLSFNDLLANSQVTEERYLQALKETSCKTTIILQRDPLECFVTNYNQDLLSI